MVFLLYRIGLPSLFPLLILVPFFPPSFSWCVLVGMVGVFLVESSPFLPLFFPWRAWAVVFGVSALGLIFYSVLISLLPLFERVIPFMLIMGLLVLLFSAVPKNNWMIPSLALCLGMGFFVFEHAVIPLSLPAWLAGFFGLSFVDSPVNPRRGNPVVHSLAGVFAGLLPGLGPGLMGLIVSSSRALPYLSLTNLVFSLGLVALSARVRSFPAAAFSVQVLPEWPTLLAAIFLGVLLASIFRSMLVWSISPVPIFFWQLAFLVVLFVFGGLSTFLVWVLAVSLARILDHWAVSPALGLAGLIPSIFLFYSAGFF